MALKTRYSCRWTNANGPTPERVDAGFHEWEALHYTLLSEEQTQANKTMTPSKIALGSIKFTYLKLKYVLAGYIIFGLIRQISQYEQCKNIQIRHSIEIAINSFTSGTILQFIFYIFPIFIPALCFKYETPRKLSEIYFSLVADVLAIWTGISLGISSPDNAFIFYIAALFFNALAALSQSEIEIFSPSKTLAQNTSTSKQKLAKEAL
ncbi:hypothetical protein [Chromobacterium sp. Rain0013]|uniref:hypothetical protein n=1 Tax=Chromobacterium sp. Rain0013 TaxID=2292447 RepID=UPI001888D6EA|nr:hypothetical protein [Chromobacterium sp. Rain0013]